MSIPKIVQNRTKWQNLDNLIRDCSITLTMKIRTQVLTVMVATALLAAVAAISLQQVSAPRDCGSCTPFKKLTHEFEKEVIVAATSGDPNLIPGLLEQYNADVRALDLTSGR